MRFKDEFPWLREFLSASVISILTLFTLGGLVVSASLGMEISISEEISNRFEDIRMKLAFAAFWLTGGAVVIQISGFGKSAVSAEMIAYYKDRFSPTYVYMLSVFLVIYYIALYVIRFY